MKFVEIALKEGFIEKKVTFSGLVNMIYSQKNSSGKTTFMRSIFIMLPDILYLVQKVLSSRIWSSGLQF